MVKTKLQFGNVLQFYEMKYHNLKVDRLNEGWSAENVIKGEVDIPENL